ncbi:2-C-methyl-D-erythritol 4-phosphate cytidylyltransferase [Aliagarivorans taiwanensis]|uniref:2-C-methyl-D-erythritol 4-phosphate cytidylyltransferase n=1 Tax=Aliagarivorans taiwanensis TaxID=561966 RepID=UPI0003FA8A53|nr:2-C-methyl-D-erythritol 4-phosphate cytidylyltransferase [Aliagarivorans taiwanensis]
MSEAIIAVIPAAGIGSRMQAAIPKQYLPMGEATLLEHTLNVFLSHPRIDAVVVALHPEDQQFQALACAKHPRLQTVVGGGERADSVLAALQVCSSDAWVMVHDAARPCLTRHDLNSLISHCEAHNEGAILASPAKDTMKRECDGHVDHTVERQQLWHAMTPQMFRCGPLTDALQQALQQDIAVTDEASAMEAAGLSVALVEGRSDNLKVTRPEDLPLAQWLIQQIKQEQA